MKLHSRPQEEASGDALLRHPGFNATHRAFLLEYNQFQTDTPRANRVLDNQARVILCNCILHLHFCHRHGCGRFATPGRLQVMMEELGLYSARGVDLALSELRAAHFVTITASDEDRRVCQVAPTPDLIALYQRYARVPLTALDRLKPGRHYVATLEQTAELFDYMSLVAGEHHTKVITPMRRPDAFVMMQHTGGHRLLTELLEMACAVDINAPDQVPLHVSINIIAEHCRISRSQTRLLLEEAQIAGLIVHERRAFYRVTPLLVSTFAAHFVQILHDTEHNFETALAELARRRSLSMDQLGYQHPVPPERASPAWHWPLWCEMSGVLSYLH